MKRTVYVVLGALLLVSSSAFAADSIREGYWEVTSQTEMPGMPMKIPASTIKHCYTKEDVKDQKKVIARDTNCTMTVKVKGKRIGECPKK